MRERIGCCDIEDDCVMNREEDEVKADVGDDSLTTQTHLVSTRRSRVED
jgi:hypothetical protein